MKQAEYVEYEVIESFLLDDLKAFINHFVAFNMLNHEAKQNHDENVLSDVMVYRLQKCTLMYTEYPKFFNLIFYTKSMPSS